VVGVQVHPGGAGEADGVEAGVLAEAAVLDGDQRGGEVGWEVGEAQGFAVEVAGGGD
jgi:hypothetical protein